MRLVVYSVRTHWPATPPTTSTHRATHATHATHTPPTPPTMASITGKGRSASWRGQHASVLKIINAFIEQDEAVRDFGEWDKLPEDIVCAIPFYERLAHFLLNVYTIPTGVGNMGESLSGDTPKNYLGIAINQAADKWKAVGQDATKRFFSCQDEKSTSDQRRESGCRGSHDPLLA